MTAPYPVHGVSCPWGGGVPLSSWSRGKGRGYPCPGPGSGEGEGAPVLVVARGGGTLVLVLPKEGYHCPRTWLGYPSSPSPRKGPGIRGQGVPSSPRKNQRPVSRDIPLPLWTYTRMWKHYLPILRMQAVIKQQWQQQRVCSFALPLPQVFLTPAQMPSCVLTYSSTVVKNQWVKTACFWTSTDQDLWKKTELLW